MKMRERFEKIKEQAVSLAELFYHARAEYYFQNYEYAAFEKMLRLKWELLTVEGN